MSQFPSVDNIILQRRNQGRTGRVEIRVYVRIVTIHVSVNNDFFFLCVCIEKGANQIWACTCMCMYLYECKVLTN